MPSSHRFSIVRLWEDKSSLRKFEDYTAWSLYVIAIVLPIVIYQWYGELQRTGHPLAFAAFYWVLVPAVLIVVVLAIRAALRASSVSNRTDGGDDASPTADRAAAPRMGWLIGALVVLAVAAQICAAVLYRELPLKTSGPTVWLPALFAAVPVAALAGLVPLRTVVLSAVGMLGVLVVIWFAIGWPALWVISRLPGVAVLIVSSTVAVRAAMSMLMLMYQVDRARRTEAQLAVAEERLRFGRDMHDTLGRNLSAIALKSQLARQLASRSAGQAEAEMSAVRQIAEESLAEMRAVVSGYRAVDLEAELSGARSLLRSANIACEMRIAAGDVPEDLREAVGWLVREGVTNVIRHSRATYCRISAAGDGAGALVVTVVNDRPHASSGGGTGLRGLAERLGAVGGSLSGERAGDEFVLTATFTRESVIAS